MDTNYEPITPLQIPQRDPDAPRPTEAEIDRAMAYIDGVHGAAGHHISDPVLRDLLRQFETGDITAEECRELSSRHIQQRVGP